MAAKPEREQPEPKDRSLRRQYEKLRKELAGAMTLTPLAYSGDGKVFGYEAPLRMPLVIGAYVVLKVTGRGEYLGQIAAQEIVQREGPEYGVKATADLSIIITKATTETNFVDRLRLRHTQGVGEVLGRIAGGGIEPTTAEDAFDEATIEAAPAETVALYLAGKEKAAPAEDLDVGYALFAEKGKARVRLQQKGFRRHTFLCGQSRSGKTFALGVILERILMSDNAPRIVILDPNSDFVRLNQPRSKAEHDSTRHAPLADAEFAALAARYAKAMPGLRILRAAGAGGFPLRIRLNDLSRYEQGAVLQLHPIKDLHSFNAFAKAIDGLGDVLYSWQVLIDKLMREYSEATLDLALRIQNLRVAEWGVWCQTQEPSIAQELRGADWRCMVIDTGSLASSEQRTAVAVAVLNHLWATKSPEKPVLLALDEAHNVCPQQPSNQLEEIATDYLVRFAGEGLKYGLRMLLASQRPAKIHVNVLSQCENLILMRMNSAADLANIGQTFSQAPGPMLARSRHFSQGESLITGEIARGPTFAKFEGRITHEGGGDLPAR